MPRPAVVLFSKDRPFQAHQFLDSLYRCVDVGSVHVIYRGTTEKAREGYLACVTAHPTATWHEEAEFRADLLAIFDGMEDEAVMFAVDDILFVAKAEMRAWLDVLRNPRVLALHLKLHPGICFSHPSGRVCMPPRLISATDFDEFGGPCVYERDGARGDWDYPLDFCASVYRTADVRRILSLIQTVDASLLDHPNTFEAGGNRVLRCSAEGRQLLAARPLSAAATAPLLHVLTVNRVQSRYDNPVYPPPEAEGGDLCALAVPATDMAGALELSPPSYARRSYCCVHIGDVFLRRHAACEGITPPRAPPHAQPPLVSVLLPVYNGAASVATAVRSVQAQTLTCWELVVVDDGSTDGTGAVLRELASADARIRVLLLEANRGVAAALNHGLAHCASDLVARIDTDDRAHPGRLARQVEFLDEHPGVDAVGSAVRIVRSTSGDRGDGGGGGGGGGDSSGSGGGGGGVDGEARPPPGGRIVFLPTDPAHALWDSHFYCTLAHPAVTFRRSAVERVGGYPVDAPHAEDYALWLRLLQRRPLGVANLGACLTELRKGASNISSRHAVAQAGTALGEAAKSAAHWIGRAVPLAVMRVAREPVVGAPALLLNAAAALLLALERAVLARIRGELRPAPTTSTSAGADSTSPSALVPSAAPPSSAASSRKRVVGPGARASRVGPVGHVGPLGGAGLPAALVASFLGALGPQSTAHAAINRASSGPAAVAAAAVAAAPVTAPTATPGVPLADADEAKDEPSPAAPDDPELVVSHAVTEGAFGATIVSQLATERLGELAMLALGAGAGAGTSAGEGDAPDCDEASVRAFLDDFPLPGSLFGVWAARDAARARAVLFGGARALGAGPPPTAAAGGGKDGGGARARH